MTHLHEQLASRVSEWRKAHYPCPEYPAISEIFDFALLEKLETSRFLRWAQLRALETYWYLRLIEKTPHIFDLYRTYFQTNKELLDSLGLSDPEIISLLLDQSIETLWDTIKTDDVFVKAHKLESLRETLSWLC